ncbi:MAG: FAD/NAD(P)-binding protein [Deltaproteobacteria bacterium]|nr:FAD/NAD(P)-binding protein [Deltaproteobacteria bacterium]
MATLDLDWLILGGGVHGTLLSRFLLATQRVARSRLRVLDPHPQPLAQWQHCARSVGMRYMRSPSVHHIDVPSFSMRKFADATQVSPRDFVEPYHRPRVDVFDSHCRWVIDAHDLEELRLQGTATDLRRAGEGWCVHTDAGELRSRRVVLALGSTHGLAWPSWAQDLDAPGRIEHVLDPGFSRDDVATTDDVAIVGGAISAAQLALALAAQPGRTGGVQVLARRAPRTRQFDTDPGWLGPRYLAGFQRQPCLRERRRMIDRARGGGTIPPQEWRRIRRAMARGVLSWHHAEVAAAWMHPLDCRLDLRLRSGQGLRVDRVLLATGFDRRRPVPAWLEAAALALELPRAPCGAPVLDAHLQWAPGLGVTGPGAELVLGPAARNVSGARMAADRLRALA